MDKYQFFIRACKAKKHEFKEWVISAFSVVVEDPQNYIGDNYMYRIVQTPTGSLFVNERQELEAIEGTVGGKPPFFFREQISLKAGDFENVKKDTITTLGNLFFNLCCIIPAFGAKLEFQTGAIDIKKVEALIAKRLQDTPAIGVARDDRWLYVDEYVKFRDSFGYLTEFTQLCTIALTPKAITPAPGIDKLREKLVKENEGRLDDPAVVADIEKQLIAYDADYLKGDPSEDFLITKKSRGSARKKLFVTYGADPGLTNSFKVDYVVPPLVEGWDVNKMPTMINALRAGSYDRGAETELGGAAVKWLYRASSNVNIIDTDCGTRLGIGVVVTPINFKNIVNLRVITANATKLIEDEQEAGAYIGKKIMIRSPMYCKLEKTDYCRYCVGERLGINPNSAATAISDLGSSFLSASLQSFHSKSIETQRASLDEILN